MNKGKKRIFISLILGMLAIYGIVFMTIWGILSHLSPRFHHLFLNAILTAFILMMAAMSIGIFCLVYSLWNYRSVQKLNTFNKKIVEFFYPAVMKLGKICGISEEAIEDSYIKINNQMVLAEQKNYKPQEILILAPHCLQKVDCPHKITIDVHNCHRCGRCSIHGLLTIAEERDVHFVVASGGTFARKFAQEIKPKVIIAIACERDLTSGIQDMQKVPVIGILNERPNGPCYNTTVQLCKVNRALDYLLDSSTIPPKYTS